jgi:hypothetical protein
MNQQTFTPESGAGDRTARPGHRLARSRDEAEGDLLGRA